MRTTTLLTWSLAVALLGCEPVAEPDVTVPDPSFDTGPFTTSASGTAITPAPDWLQEPGYFRTFSFAARGYADGTAEGHFQYHIHDLNSWGHGDVICMTIKDNTAWVGGIYTQHSNPDAIGTERIFAVIDNGEAANADPDQITYIYPTQNAKAFCDNADPIGDDFWVDVEKGEILVRG